MPLTSVVDYLNERLPELHPRAHLSGHARFHCRHGRIGARVAGFRLVPRQVPVLAVATGEVFAWGAKLLVESDRGQRAIPETLYVQAWDGEDVIFLDRFLRTLHALNHLSLGADRKGLLAVDVHLRHLAALSEQHGRVFETLLRHLGLTPDRIVLRLSGTALQHDPHVREAALSFAHRGYGLLAVRPDLQSTDWAMLRALGVRWVAPETAALEVDATGRWTRQAKTQEIGLWLDGVGSPQSIARAAALGADLIEGELWESDPPARPAAEPLEVP